MLHSKPNSGPVCVILAAGAGTRMRSKSTHKVCFPIAGRPAILRALDAYTDAGIQNFRIVVGALAPQVMETVTGEFPQVGFAYQAQQRGTGHATRTAVQPLLNIGFNGPIIVTMGDKLIDPRAAKQLMQTFEQGNWDAVVGVIDRQPGSQGGRVVVRPNNTVAGIVEQRDIEKATIVGHAWQTLQQAQDETAAALAAINSYARRVIPDDDKRTTALGDLLHLVQQGDAKGLDSLLQSANTPPGTIRLGADYWQPADIDATPWQNAAFYMFKAEALVEGLQHINADNAQGEEYLTDVINYLANSGSHQVTHQMFAATDILTYNNPEQLLAVEEAFRRRQALAAVDAPADITLPPTMYRTVNEWLALIQTNGDTIDPVLADIYGSDPALWNERRHAYITALNAFGDQYGFERPVVISRAPGRVNLMGRHIEHRGGTVNVMAISKEVVMIAAPNDDDTVRVANTDPQHYPPSEFNIGEELAAVPWDDWLGFINHERVQRLVFESGGSWINYVKAALLRLQFQFRDRALRGMDVVFHGNIPVAAGLSSSSAVVVASAEAAIALNGLDVVPQDFVDLCGEGEWYVGSRGGAGDHAAMKFSRSGEVTHIGFFPFSVKGRTPFPDGVELLIANSHVKAQKMTNAKDIFNQRVASYEFGLLLLKERFPEHAPKLKHLRDLHPVHLGVRPSELYRMLLALPEKLTRDQIVELLGANHWPLLQTQFRTHAVPDYYLIRSVILYGVAEYARAELCRTYLAASDIDGVGRLMQLSHDGDRVVRFDNGRAVPYDYMAPDAYLQRLVHDLQSEDAARVKQAQLEFQPGGYACSTPEIDEMVDIAQAVPGVVGAQLSGAGLGGCIMVLVRTEAKTRVVQALTERFYEPRGLTPEITESRPVRGSMLWDVAVADEGKAGQIS